MGLCYGMASAPTKIFCLFQPLSQKWREMFESFDYNQDSIIDAAELASALNHYECVSFEVVALYT
jgi:Ca2+-binding EF-hand superfamily protein